MEKLTITEALSEINLIQKKIDKKKEVILGNVVKPKHMKDLLESQGGSKDYIKAEIQSINDLVRRHVAIRGAVAKANIENNITVGDKTDSIHNWLTYRRDFSAKQIEFKNNIYKNAKQEIDKLTRNPQVFKDDQGNTHLLELEANVDFGSFLKAAEEEQELFDKLDGQLSLKNATIVVTFKNS